MKKLEAVFIATLLEMNNPIYDNRLWIATCNIELSRRKFLDEIASTIYGYRGLILVEGGQVWPIPDVYEVMGEEGRWISYYRKEVNGRPLHKPRPSTLERRRIIDLYFRIKHPLIAEDFKSEVFKGESEIIQIKH